MPTDTLPAWREAVERALDECPSSAAIRHSLADLLDEAGDPDAEPVRRLADRGKWPTAPGFSRNHGSVRTTWDWWSPSFRDVPLHARAAMEIWVILDHFGQYPTRRSAEADFCRAYHAARAAGWSPGVNSPAPAADVL